MDGGAGRGALIQCARSMSGLSKTVLICDDDQGMRDTIAAILQREYRVLSVPSGESALSVLKQEDVDVLLLDVRLPGINGLDVLRIVRENYGFVECIVISAISEVETAVQAMKYGAYHYVTKTFEYDELRSLVRNACEHQDLNRQVAMLSAQVAEGEREFLIGPSRQIREIVDLVHKVAKLSATVLILGESGTGKELLARLLHRESGRRDAPFIAVNLSAIPHELVESTLFGHERGSFTGAHKQQLGKFELASGGTLFLDEIGDLRLDLQAKLLRAIQEGEIERIGGTKPIRTNFRLVVATNVDVEKAAKEGRFREDLYYRINVIPIRMPPLRERLDDLPELARLFSRALPGQVPKAGARDCGFGGKDLGLVLVARQHPGAREPDRATGRGQRQGVDHRRGPADGVPPRQAGLRPGGRRDAVPGGLRHLRAQLHSPRAREVRLERDRDRPLSRDSAQHAEAQDGSSRAARSRAQAARRLTPTSPPSVPLRLVFQASGWPGRPITRPISEPGG